MGRRDVGGSSTWVLRPSPMTAGLEVKRKSCDKLESTRRRGDLRWGDRGTAGAPGGRGSLAGAAGYTTGMRVEGLWGLGLD